VEDLLNRLVLPVLIKPRDQGAPMVLRLRMDYGICDDICLPARDRVNMNVDFGAVQNQDVIGAAIALRSQPAAQVGMTSATCKLRADGEDFVLNAEFGFEGDPGAHRLVVVETGSDMIWVSEADHMFEAGALQVENAPYGLFSANLGTKCGLCHEVASIEVEPWC